MPKKKKKKFKNKMVCQAFHDMAVDSIKKKKNGFLWLEELIYAKSVGPLTGLNLKKLVLGLQRPAPLNALFTT